MIRDKLVHAVIALVQSSETKKDAKEKKADPSREREISSVRDGERASSGRVPGASESDTEIIFRRHHDAEGISVGSEEQVRGKQERELPGGDPEASPRG